MRGNGVLMAEAPSVEDLDALALAIKADLAAEEGALRNNSERARDAGEKLKRAWSALAPQHEWNDWLDREGIEQRTAQRRIRIFDHWSEIPDTVSSKGVAEVLKFLRGLRRRRCGPRLVKEPGCIVADLWTLVETGRTFGTIYADPPWRYGNQATRASTDNHYVTMPLDELTALPVPRLAAPRCHLHLWTTNGFLRDALALLDAWGFVYKSVFVWVKPQVGIGNYWRVSHEFLLLGVRGQLTFADRSLRSWGKFDRGEHSAKPEQVRGMIERASPGHYLELFGRNAVPGWVVWGNEVSRDLFTQEVESL